MKTKNIYKVLMVISATLIIAADKVEPEDFKVSLDLKNGHLANVLFGCSAGASDGYDQKFDAMAPPPGIETGYTAFLPASGQSGFPLYMDIRAHAAEITWHFGAQVFQGKPVQVSWDAKKLPEAYDFYIFMPQETDMRVRHSIEIPETATVRIVARLKK